MLDTVGLEPEARQDLSFADQQELLAFIEKRNWFEVKLESLKSLSPVYPFVHPDLARDQQSTAGYIRRGADNSPWRLPDRAQLAAWISERNALEDEVDRFDDGDMERMKEKTRQMTRVPLTQPSTDLVEVTLDLILLIDQLHMVLKHRGSVLDLASLRLQWDDLRFESSREAESVKAEIDHVVAEAQAWLPGAQTSDRNDRRGGLRHVSVSQPRMRASSSNASLSETGLATVPSPSLSVLPPSPGNNASSPRSGPPSPSKPGGPKSTLHLSILRSQLVGLQTRHRNFSYTLVKRSSGILDKMIDSAGRLKGLGGVDGPLEDSQGNVGAVPEQLIDIQEAIEDQARDIGERVVWCGHFEQQWRQAQAHCVAAAHAQASADDLLLELERALAEPASSERHATLAQLYSEATSALPPMVDHTFPTPSHPEYPSKDEHNMAILNVMKSTRGSAQTQLDLAGQALAFYASLLKAREALVAQKQRVDTVRLQLAQVMDHLEHGSPSAPRPSITAVAEKGGDCTHWLQSAHGWLSQGDELAHSANDTFQSTSLAIMQYSRALVCAPIAVKTLLPATGVPDDLGHVVEDDASDLLSLARRCADLARQTKTDVEAVPIVMGLRRDYAEMSDDVESLSIDLVRSVNLAAWSPSPTTELPTPTELAQQLRAIINHSDASKMELQRLKNIVGSQSKTAVLLESNADELRASIDLSRDQLDIFSRVEGQAEVVRAIQSKAQDFLAQIDNARQVIPGDLDTASVSIGQLKMEVARWTSGLADRAIFVSDQPLSLWSTTSRDQGSAPLTPPLTPVYDESSSTTFMPDLVALDARVRNEVNRQSGRVSAAMAHIISAADDEAFNRWAAPVMEMAAALVTASDGLSAVLSDLATRTRMVQDTEGEARRALAVEVQHAGQQALADPVAAVHSLITSLNTTLGANASDGIDMRRAANVFSSSDVAREAGLARTVEAEQWLKDAARLVLEANTKLEAEKEFAQLDAQAKQVEVTKKAIRDLDDQLEALDLDNVVNPSPIALRTTPKHRRLPTARIAQTLASTFSTINHSATTMAETKQSPEVNRFLDKLQRVARLVPELDGLAEVSETSAACDTAFSRLLDVVDTRVQGSEDAERQAQLAVDAFEIAAGKLMSDARVAAERKRVTRAWADLRSMADDGFGPRNSSVAGSVESTEGRVTKPRTRERKLSTARNTRHASMPPPPLPPKVESSRPRVASVSSTSNSTKGRTPLRARASIDPIQMTPRTPRPRLSAPPAPPSMSTSKPLTPTIPQPFRLSSSSSASSGLSRSSSGPAETPTRKPRLSAPPSLAKSPLSHGPTKATSKLDVAVANVLDTLGVDVPIVPAGRQSPDEWKDESGRYWIGTGGRARLCFCRILRSRTVMVRVGGGWAELSRYLLDRFADSLVEEPAHTVRSQEWQSVPIAITSATLAASTSLSASTRSDRGTPRTPARQPIPAFQGSPLLSTPIQNMALIASPASGESSPLIPVVIRKASESPVVREKEREQIQQRPSFLREASAPL